MTKLKSLEEANEVSATRSAASAISTCSIRMATSCRLLGSCDDLVKRACSGEVCMAATVDRLRALYPQGRFEIRRFRPNVVVETTRGECDFVENACIGHLLALGDAVRLSIAGPCARCVMTTLPQSDLPRDTGILRTAAQHNRASVGVYASVVQAGTVHRGDHVTLN